MPISEFGLNGERGSAMVLATIALPPAGDTKDRQQVALVSRCPLLKNTDGPKRYGDLIRPR